MEDEATRRYERSKLPTGHQLRSALRCARLIDKAGVTVERLRMSYRLVPYGGLYRSDDLIEAETLLTEAGLLLTVDNLLVPMSGLDEIAQASETDGCEALLAALLQHDVPLWLLAATSGSVLAEELIPDEESHKLHSVLGPEQREALLLAIGRRYSDNRQTLTGSIAEHFVVAQCQAELRYFGEPELAKRVRRVSEISDQLGYDVTAPRRDRSTRRIEVKGSRGDGAGFVMHLSRNEAERGLADPDWSLVACRIARDDSPQLVGHIYGSQLRPYLPEDRRSEARWESVRLEFPETGFTPGLPPIE
jgi:Domain of unknown function (DUF3883)